MKRPGFMRREGIVSILKSMRISGDYCHLVIKIIPIIHQELQLNEIRRLRKQKENNSCVEGKRERLGPTEERIECARQSSCWIPHPSDISGLHDGHREGLFPPCMAETRCRYSQDIDKSSPILFLHIERGSKMLDLKGEHEQQKKWGKYRKNTRFQWF